MKFFYTLVSCLFFAATAAQAQTFSAGIKGGASMSFVEIKKADDLPYYYDNPENITGFHFGGFGRAQYKAVFLQPEVLFSYTGGKIERFETKNGLHVQMEEFKFSKVDIPLMAGIILFERLRLQAGPMASLYITARESGVNVRRHLDGSRWGYQAGVGIDVWKFTFDLRYERITNHYKNERMLKEYELNSEQLIGSIGIKLFE